MGFETTVTLGQILTWIVTIGVALFLFVFYYRIQMRTAKSQRDISRMSTLRQLEEEISKLFREKSVRIKSRLNRELASMEFRYCLDNEPPWDFVVDSSSKRVAVWPAPESLIIDGKRHWVIRQVFLDDESQYTQYLASESFQEVLLWFRRIERAHRARIVYTRDLCDLWRFILPFGFSGRLVYFSRYFQGQAEISSICYTISETLRGCCELGWNKPIHYLTSYLTEGDRKILFNSNNAQEFNKMAEVLSSKDTVNATNA